MVQETRKVQGHGTVAMAPCVRMGGVGMNIFLSRVEETVGTIRFRLVRKRERRLMVGITIRFYDWIKEH